MAFAATPTWNSTTIATAALNAIGQASVDDPPSAEDLALAIQRLDALNQNFAARGIYYQGDLDSTPAAVALLYYQALAEWLKPDFGYATPQGGDGLKSTAEIDMQLRRIGADGPSYGPQQVSFF